MNDAEQVHYVNSVYVKTVGSEWCEWNFAVGANYYPRYGISLGKISKLCIQSGSDVVGVIAKIVSDKKEFLLTSMFFRNNIVCFETTEPYNYELEEDE